MEKKLLAILVIVALAGAGGGYAISYSVYQPKIASLRSDLDSLASSLSVLQASLLTLQGRLTSLNASLSSDIDSLQSRIDEFNITVVTNIELLNTEIDGLKTDVNELKSDVDALKNPELPALILWIEEEGDDYIIFGIGNVGDVTAHDVIIFFQIDILWVGDPDLTASYVIATIEPGVGYLIYVGYEVIAVWATCAEDVVAALYLTD